MKKVITGLTVLVWLALITYSPAQQTDLLFEPGKLIIKATQPLNIQISSNTGVPSIDSLNSYYSVSSVEQIFSSISLDPEKLALYNQIGLGRIYVLTLPDTTDILKTMDVYKGISAIEYAEPNCYLKPLDVYPCDWAFQEGWQWELYNNGIGCGKLGADIKAPQAWEIEKGDTNLTVAIVDCGIDRTLPELSNRVWVNSAERNGLPGVDDDHNGYVDDSIGWNFVTNTPFVQPTLTWHGTQMAAIMGSETDSTNYCDLGAGINWRCKLMNLRTDTLLMINDTLWIVNPTEAVAEAIWYAARNGAKVINLSLAWHFNRKISLPDSLHAIEDALAFAYNLGVVSVAGMGNRVDDFYPAASSKTLAVGATDCNDDRVRFYGWESNYADYIDLVAPGMGLFICFPPYEQSGTSASTAVVSGITSLVVTHRKKLVPNAALSAEQIYEVIRHTADDTVGHTYTLENPPQLEDHPCFDFYYGWGRANTFKALVAVSHGDANNDSRINIGDITYLVNYLFKGGPPPVPVLDMGDANCDKRVTIVDTVYLVSYLFKGGPPPSLCYTDCSQP